MECCTTMSTSHMVCVRESMCAMISKYCAPYAMHYVCRTIYWTDRTKNRLQWIKCIFEHDVDPYKWLIPNCLLQSFRHLATFYVRIVYIFLFASVRLCDAHYTAYRFFLQAFITLNFLVSGYHQYNNNIKHPTKTHLSFRYFGYYYIYIQRAVCYTFVLSVLSIRVCVFGSSISFTQIDDFLLLFRAPYADRTLEIRNHHSQHMHTTDSFNICFCASFCCCFVFVFLYSVLSWWKQISSIYIDHHFYTYKMRRKERRAREKKPSNRFVLCRFCF